MYYAIPHTTVRVLGSMHMVPNGAEPVPTWARDAYDWCDQLFIEGDPKEFLPRARSHDASLQARLPPKLWDALSDMWPVAGPLAPLEQLHPWAALIFYSVLRLGNWPVPGIEPNLLSIAAADGKDVGYLETGAGVATFGAVS